MTDSTRRSNVASHVIGIAGGSGSGKTFFAEAIRTYLGPKICEIIYQDSFYIDQSARFDFDGGSVNFDHPDSIDFDLLAKRISALKSGEPAEIPIYDFKTHQRKPQTFRVEPKPVILVDGILIFHAEQVRTLFDDLIFFDTSEELRFSRRLDRDVNERGRTPDGVRNQFLKQVKPMHDAYVDPSKSHANVTVRESADFKSILDGYCRRLEKFCNERDSSTRRF